MSGMIDFKSLFQIVYDAFSAYIYPIFYSVFCSRRHSASFISSITKDFILCLYSFLIAASGLNLIARFAGK